MRRNRNKKSYRGECNEKISLVLGILFSILTFVGAGYVLSNHGQVNAGYACVPIVFALASLTIYRKNK